MKRRECLYVFGAGFAGLAATAALADEHGHGHGNDHDDDDDHGHGHGNDHGHGHGNQKYEERFSDRDREQIREWHHAHGNNLPPGLAKRDTLPPGLERQLEARGTLPPGLRSRMYHCPEDLERRLPPPPPDCEHVIISGHIVLLNRKSFAVLDVFHLSL